MRKIEMPLHGRLHRFWQWWGDVGVSITFFRSERKTPSMFEYDILFLPKWPWRLYCRLHGSHKATQGWDGGRCWVCGKKVYD